MVQRAAIVVECDNDQKTIEKEDAEELHPEPWRHIVLTIEPGQGYIIDACSIGCAERAVVKTLRSAYGIPEAAGVGIRHDERETVPSDRDLRSDDPG